jgi:tRNA threonylcarbamoyl adenosine modification protein YjeE
MTASRHLFANLDEDGVCFLAQCLAFCSRRGDLIALWGDLGAGKTTFARAFISSLLGGGLHEVPSPTFTLVQTYDTAQFPLSHFDLYRIADAREVDELGLDDVLETGLALVEWPARAGDRLGPQRIDVTLAETASDSEHRDVVVEGHGIDTTRLERLAAIHALLAGAGFAAPGASLAYLQGDASTRRYARLSGPAGAAILMDWPRQPDGPPIRDGLPYSRIAHLAEDVRPFVAIADHLAAAGFSTPRLLAHDIAHGLLVIEDLGNGVFGELVRAAPERQPALWRAATEVLAALAAIPVPPELPVRGGGVHVLPAYDSAAMAIEVELLLDWYWPAVRGGEPPREARAAFADLWSEVFRALADAPSAWVLRDYHSPNLLWCPRRDGLARVGIIDFQDAMRGPAAYDLVSLLQDARIDVPAALEAELLARYGALAAARTPAFDADAFAFTYAALGAQRATKILGIFARLWRRDGKPQYLRHLPRVWGYLERNLAHPLLRDLAAWYDQHLPSAVRAGAAATAEGAP